MDKITMVNLGLEWLNKDLVDQSWQFACRLVGGVDHKRTPN